MAWTGCARTSDRSAARLLDPLGRITQCRQQTMQSFDVRGQGRFVDTIKGHGTERHVGQDFRQSMRVAAPGHRLDQAMACSAVVARATRSALAAGGATAGHSKPELLLLPRARHLAGLAFGRPRTADGCFGETTIKREGIGTRPAVGGNPRIGVHHDRQRSPQAPISVGEDDRPRFMTGLVQFSARTDSG